MNINAHQSRTLFPHFLQIINKQTKYNAQTSNTPSSSILRYKHSH